MRQFFLVLIVLAGLTGCSRNPVELGRLPTGISLEPIASARTHFDTVIMVQGRMVEKCPVAGCWFQLQDASGTMKVDTKGAGFVVAMLPIGSPLVVAGRLNKVGDEIQLEATGVRTP